MLRKIKLSELKQAIKENYLPADFIQRLREDIYLKLVFTDDDNVCLSCDTIETECGSVWHEALDDNEYIFDEIDECYINENDSCRAYGSRGREVITSESNCSELGGNYYVTEFLSDNDIVTLHDGELSRADDCHYVEDEGEYYRCRDCYYWDSDGQYHLEEEEENKENTLFDYASGPREKDFTSTDRTEGQQVFGWGIEIEKNEMPDFDFEKNNLYKTTGAVIERDGSVSDGFELKTPIYNLLSSKTDERLTALRDFCNVRNVDGAGGHIGFSMQGKNDEELLDLCRGFLPIIYAMHKKRCENTYCPAKPINKLKEDGCKYQSIRLRGNYIEFRIFSSVKNFSTITFRLSFFRIMALNLGANFGKVLLMAANVNHPLHKLLVSVYNTEKKYSRLINNAIELDKLFGAGRLTQQGINNISGRVSKIFKDIVLPANNIDFSQPVDFVE